MKAKFPLADRTQHISSSAIREILKALASTNIISFAGGSPATELFPIKDWHTMIDICHTTYGARLYQYGITEGLHELREVLAQKCSSIEHAIDAQDIVITTGAQSAIELAAKILLNKHDPMVIESPTFLASLNTFALFEPSMISIPLQHDGIDLQKLEHTLSKQKDIKVLYLIPNFQNPTGITLSREKRQRIADLLRKYKVYLIEDDPYRDLRYEGEHYPTIHSLAPKYVIYVGSLSKIFSPGMRLGYCIAPEHLRGHIVAAKQATDVHTNVFAQALATEFLRSITFPSYLHLILETYKQKRDSMLRELQLHFPSSFSYTYPAGGMFIWVEGPQHFNATTMYTEAIQNGIAYVPGTFFYHEKNQHHNTFRLNFTGPSRENITKGIHILGQMLHNKLAATI